MHHAETNLNPKPLFQPQKPTDVRGLGLTDQRTQYPFIKEDA